MTQDTTLTQIGELIPKLMKAVGSIGKDRENSHQRYKFRGIDDVLNHVSGPCSDLGLRVEPHLSEYENQRESWEENGRIKFRVHVSLKMSLKFYAPDGSCHICEGYGEGQDTSGDKATNKAMSAAFKYAMFMGLVIAVDGALDDSDNDAKQPAAETPKPLSPEDRIWKVFAGHSASKTKWFEIAWPWNAAPHKGKTLGDIAAENDVVSLSKLHDHIKKLAAGREEKEVEYLLDQVKQAIAEANSEPPSTAVPGL